MEEQRATQALAAHADRLIGRPGETVRLTPDEAEQLRPLMDVAEHVKATLIPVEPSAAFVRTLGRELVEAARHQQTAARRLRRGLVIGAAAVGSALSVAGVVALIVMRRRSEIEIRPRPASG